MALASASDRAHVARFVWDDGHGETCCSARYLELRNLHKVALGRAAEARLCGKDAEAMQFEQKAHALAAEMDGLRRLGHVGQSTHRDASEFRSAFAAARAETLQLV